MTYLEGLQNDFDASKDKFEELFETATKQSVIQIISKGGLFNLTPFESQIAGFKLGKECKTLPKT